MTRLYDIETPKPPAVQRWRVVRISVRKPYINVQVICNDEARGMIVCHDESEVTWLQKVFSQDRDLTSPESD